MGEVTHFYFVNMEDGSADLLGDTVKMEEEWWNKMCSPGK